MGVQSEKPCQLDLPDDLTFKSIATGNQFLVGLDQDDSAWMLYGNRQIKRLDLPEVSHHCIAKVRKMHACENGACLFVDLAERAKPDVKSDTD
jgi:hypothetical protein